MSNKASLSLLSLLLLLPATVMAHTGSPATGFLQGISHPVGGLDHLLAMLAVGLWASQLGGRALWIVPSIFVIVMMFGGLLGLSAVDVPFIEAGILLSVLVFGSLIAGALKFPIIVSAVIVSIFALFHGYAHGTEMPTIASSTSYIIGFSLATITLHAIGVALGKLLQKTNLEKIARYTGAAIVLSGLFLAM